MPVLERDPWRYQFFEHVACPVDVVIPTDDPDCWVLQPRHRWVYDKLKIAESQGIICGPHGVPPPHYPVFSKPMTNLKGMGIGSRVIAAPSDLDDGYEPGHMWMELLEGAHVSTDCAVVDGEVVWLRHATGQAAADGMFRMWTIHAEAMPDLAPRLADWCRAHMGGYTGMMNFETIGSRIIEAHLRFADQWCDLYGRGWVEALVGLYRDGRWTFDDSGKVDGYSLPLFARHGGRYRHPSPELQAAVRAMPHVSSLQVTFYEDRAPELHPMPPGGFRIGIVNATDLAAGLKALRVLARCLPADAVVSDLAISPHP